MLIWSILGVGLLLLILITVIIIIERRRINSGIIIASNYIKLLVAGIIIMLLSIGGMVMLALFFPEIPFYIGMPLLGMGVVYIVVGLVYRKEWIKWVDSYSQSEEEIAER